MSHSAYSAEVADIGTVNTMRAAKGLFPVVTPAFILMKIFVAFSKRIWELIRCKAEKC